MTVALNPASTSAGPVLAFALALALAGGARAQDASPPSGPTAAAPNPAAGDGQVAPAAAPGGLSPICTDRPTKSNAACTVDAGHFQYETDLFNGTFFRSDGTTTDIYLVTNPTLKYGLSKTVDVEVNIAPYEVVRSHSDLQDSTLGGIGDLYLRLKYNAFNTKDGKFSLSVLPYIKAPTARLGIGNGAVEGGVIFPISYKLTDKLSITTAPEFDDFKDAVGTGRHFNTAQLVNIGYSLPANVTVYGELWGDWNYDRAGLIQQASADVAASWGLTNTLQLDGGLNFGLNHNTPGVQAYVGVSQKF